MAQMPLFDMFWGGRPLPWKIRGKNGGNKKRHKVSTALSISREEFSSIRVVLRSGRIRHDVPCFKLDPPYAAIPYITNCGISASTFFERVNGWFAELASFVQNEFWFDDRLNQFNHVPHFPHYVTCTVDSVPIHTDTLHDYTFNPKYAGPVWKVTLLTSLLGDIIFPPIGPHLGTMSDSQIWGESGPWKHMEEREVCLSDCAYSGRSRIVAPFWKPHGRTMPGKTKLYNEMHSYYRGRGEHAFALAYPFAIMRHAWNGKEAGGHERLAHRVRVLFGFLSFHLHRRLRYEPFGPWSHFPQSSSSSTPAPVPTSTVQYASAQEHEGAVVDEWDSDHEGPQFLSQRLTRSLTTFCTALGVSPE